MESSIASTSHSQQGATSSNTEGGPNSTQHSHIKRRSRLPPSVATYTPHGTQGHLVQFGANTANQLSILKEDKDDNDGSDIVISNRDKHGVGPTLSYHYGDIVFDDCVSVALGPLHTLALGANGRVYTCGEGALRIGISYETEQLSLFKMVGSPLLENTVIQLVCGKDHSAALTAKGTVYLWGDNQHGQLGIPRDRVITSAVPLLNRTLSSISKAGGGLAQVACGHYHTLVLTKGTGQVFAFGKALSHQLGLGETRERDLPRLVESLDGLHIQAIACGAYHSMALTREGQVFAWGSNVHGQLGLGEQSQYEALPTLVTTLPPHIMSIACGSYHSAALSHTRTKLYVWGCGEYGRLGTGDEESRLQPAMISVYLPDPPEDEEDEDDEVSEVAASSRTSGSSAPSTARQPKRTGTAASNRRKRPLFIHGYSLGGTHTLILASGVPTMQKPGAMDNEVGPPTAIPLRGSETERRFQAERQRELKSFVYACGDGRQFKLGHEHGQKCCDYLSPTSVSEGPRTALGRMCGDSNVITAVYAGEFTSAVLMAPSTPSDK